MSARRRAGRGVRRTGDAEHGETPAETASAPRRVFDWQIGVLHGTEKFNHLSVLDRLVLIEWHGGRIADTRARFARPVHCPDAFPSEAPPIRNAPRRVRRQVARTAPAAGDGRRGCRRPPRVRGTRALGRRDRQRQGHRPATGLGRPVRRQDRGLRASASPGGEACLHRALQAARNRLHQQRSRGAPARDRPRRAPVEAASVLRRPA